jgi:hypothetical protein
MRERPNWTSRRSKPGAKQSSHWRTSLACEERPAARKPIGEDIEVSGGLGERGAAGGSDEPRRAARIPKDKLATYKAIPDRWSGAYTTPVALKPRSMGPKR